MVWSGEKWTNSPKLRSAEKKIQGISLRGPIFERDKRLDLLAGSFAGRADHRRHGHSGVGHEHLFDFPGVDVEASSDDHVHDPIHDVYATIVIHAPRVARVKPTGSLEGFPGGVGLGVVALQHVAPADGRLSHIAGGQRAELLVHHDDLHAPDTVSKLPLAIISGIS